MTADPLAFEFFNEMGIIDQLVSTMLTNALPHGITKAQFSVLNHFVRLDIVEQSPADLASAFQVRRPTMTSTLARMESAGLVVIRDDPRDGRSGNRDELTPSRNAPRLGIQNSGTDGRDRNGGHVRKCRAGPCRD